MTNINKRTHKQRINNNNNIKQNDSFIIFEESIESINKGLINESEIKDGLNRLFEQNKKFYKLSNI